MEGAVWMLVFHPAGPERSHSPRPGMSCAVPTAMYHSKAGLIKPADAHGWQ
jgi:hypothetical protein